MDSEGVLMPLVHEHLMMPWNDLRKGDCCGLLEAISTGYYCKSCDFFVHKKCGESSEFIKHPSHPDHTLQLRSEGCNTCSLCGRIIKDLFYRCDLCDFDVDLYCAKNPPPEVIDIPETHHHKLNLHKELIQFNCDAKCGKITGAEFPYACYECQLPFHVDCVWRPSELKHPSEVIHSYHSLHPLKLLTGQLPDNSDGKCRLCARNIDERLFYHCSPCNFTLDMRCVVNPPQQSLLNLNAHDHQLTLLPRLFSFTCNACGLDGDRSPYICVQCDFMIHQDCLDLPRVINIHRHEHRVSRTSVPGVVNSKGVLLPVFHKHLMMPWNDLRKGDCCQSLESDTDGFYCKSCDFFVHKKCGESFEFIKHPSHPDYSLQLRSYRTKTCNFCGRWEGMNAWYRCMNHCDFQLDLYCAKYPPPEVIDISETHHHKLTLLKEHIEFDCDAKCGMIGDGFSYKCPECDLSFHVDCVWHPPEVNHPLEVNHSYHPWHPLKLHTGQPPDYSDGTCRLCARKIDDRLFYHCSSCNFTLDLRCVLNPPPQSLLNLKAHDHQLTLLPRLRSFTCNACGLSGDRSPYICLQCDFMIHQDCLDLPRLININRHDHRISRTSVLVVVNSICGVCRQKVDWTCGGFSCQRCPGYVVHSKCATRSDVWNGKELEGVPEETEDTEPYVVIDDNTIQHFSHKEHYLRLYVNGFLCDDNKRCSACTHPICLQSFYGCMDCDFILHQNCAGFPRMRWHVLHNERLTLVTNETIFSCAACARFSNGFRYEHRGITFDVRCGSISEPFVHPSHLDHPLYYTLPDEEIKSCSGCKKHRSDVLRCIEDDCSFVLCFTCATLPQVVKHRVDNHPLSLCYGEKASGKYWCDICEKETNPETWFYTCKDHRASLHTKCVLGDLSSFMPRSTIEGNKKSYEVVLNNSVSRPLCSWCKMHCIYPIILKTVATSDEYFCTFVCLQSSW